MTLDEATARELRRSTWRAWYLAFVAAVIVFGFIAADLVDRDRFAPAIDADQSPAWAATANIALTVGVVALLVAMIRLVRVRRQRRTVERSTFRSARARWAPTVKRAQHVPGLAVEQPDGSWLALTLAATLRPRAFESRVRATGTVDVAQLPDYAVVRAHGSTALLSAKPRGVVAEPTPFGPLTPLPLVTLRAGARIATESSGTDDGIWFREETRLPVGTAIRSLLLFVLVSVSIVRSSINGDVGSAEGVFLAVLLLTVGSLGPISWLISRTETTVDHIGITRKAMGRRPKLIALEHISTVARYPTESPTGMTNVVVTVDNAATIITIPTRRPDELVSALQRGRVFA